MKDIRLYKEKIMEYYQHPRCKGELESPTFVERATTVSCGDVVTVYGLIDNGVLVQACFNGSGCVISQAAASLLMEHVMGKPITVIQELTPVACAELLGIELGPVRLRCALLAYEALQRGIKGNCA